MGLNNDKTFKVFCINVNNSTDPHEIAEKLCQHFAALTHMLISTASRSSMKIYWICLTATLTSVSDLEQALNQLKSGNCPDMDGIVKEHPPLSATLL